MTTRFTLERLASITGISRNELIQILDKKGVTVQMDSELSKEQVMLIKDSLKNREKVSVSASTKAKVTTKSNQTIIKRKATPTSKPKLTLSKMVNKKVITQPKKPEPVVVKEDPVKAPEIAVEKPKRKEINTSIKTITIGEETSLSELAKKTLIKEVDLSQTFFNQGYMVKKNDPIDFDTAALLLDVLNITVKKAQITEKATHQTHHSGEQAERPPVVTIMGHVDHGKTSLVDYIRSTKVAQKEAGGITQHIGAYQVPTSRGLITFIDTPGHEAFSQMRSRGATVTDMIILIIAANDGIKPQTIESIQHAKSTKTPLIVAITKIDIADDGKVDQIYSALSTHDVLVEEWGGDIPVAQVSSKTGAGVEELLELISIQAELMELKAYSQGQVSAHVCEAKIDRGRGAVITLIVESGTLTPGTCLAIGPGFGKVRTMLNALQKPIKEAKPSTPIEITGISPLPKAGDIALSYPDEKTARQAASSHIEKSSSKRGKSALTLDSLFTDKAEHQLNIILKADTQGSLEAIAAILNDLKEDDTELMIIESQVGSVNSSDAALAASTGAELIAFNVNIESTAKRQLEQQNIQAQQFKIIYALIDFIKDKLVKLKGPIFKEEKLGTLDVKAVFRSSKFGQIAGCLVTEGLIKRGEKVRVIRKGETVFEGDLASIKREKETLSEARKGTECGLGIKNFSDAKVGDIIECYTLKEDV